MLEPAMNDLFDDTALTASWRLPAGRALSLRPRQAGLLQVCQGQVWATMDGPHGWREGDMFLSAGDSLVVPADQHLVIEPRDAQAAAWFSWTPQPARAAEATRWQRDVSQPVSDLRLAFGGAALALRGAAGALLRLAAGLSGLAPAWRAARGRLSGAARAFRAASSASRAHGAMS